MKTVRHTAKKLDQKPSKTKAAESGVSAAQRVFAKVLEKIDPVKR